MARRGGIHVNLLGIACRNVGRSRRRSLLSALAVAFACAALMFSMALQQGSYADMIYNAVHAHTGHLQVQCAGYREDHDLAKKLERADELLALLEQDPALVAVAPRVNAAALISKGERTFGAGLFGIDPEREARATRLDDVVVEGRYPQPGEEDAVLLGHLLARNLGATVGDEVVFLGQGADGSLAAGRLQVCGLFRFGSSEMDRSFALAPLSTIQEAYSMPDAVSEMAILLEDDRQRPAVSGRLDNLLRGAGFDEAVVLGWPILLPGVEQSIKMDWFSGLIMYTVLVLVVGFGIANTFLMAFMERMHECGVMLSLGMRPVKLSLLMYLESVVLIAAGLVTGFVLGIPLVLYFQEHGISFGAKSGDIMAAFGLSPVIYLQLSPMVMAWAAGLVGAIALIVAVYPALKAGRLKPVEALRHA